MLQYLPSIIWRIRDSLMKLFWLNPASRKTGRIILLMLQSHHFNFMSQGILWADLVTTVSETYAKEILTPEYGVGLDPLLRYRQKDLLGIVNGIDYEEYNPETDPYIQANYDSSTLERRVVNKLALQKRANLPQDAEIPLIGMVQRLDEQKGFDILEKALASILEETEPSWLSWVMAENITRIC